MRKLMVGMRRFLLLCTALLLLPALGALLSTPIAIRRDCIRDGRSPKVESSRRRGLGEDTILMHGEKITLKELHSLLIHRIYHEDNLLQQRNYNFITVNVFLGAGFVVVVAIEPTREVSLFGYVITAFEFLWAILQVAYGKRQVIATTLWRQQAWMAEKMLNTKFDLTLFEFYEFGETNTPFGTVKFTNKKKRLPNKSFLYNLFFFSGTNVVFGVTFPQMMAVFWFVLTFIMLCNHKAALWVILLVTATMVILLLLCWGRPATPEGILNEHIPDRYAHEDRRT